jgi:hypothetical protein
LIGGLTVGVIFVVLGIDCSIILKLIFKKESERSWTVSVGLRRGKMKGYCNASLELMKSEEVLEKLETSFLPTKKFAPQLVWR